MPRKLYELVGREDDRPFSPYCWRTRMALAHKGLNAECVPWRFTEKDVIAFSGQERVPVLVDDGKVVSDSWAIATYLDDAYPDAPSLFGGLTARATAAFFNNWVDNVVNPAVLRVVLLDVYNQLGDADKAYFRKSREARFGMTLEKVVEDPEAKIAALRQALQPARLTLEKQPYLGGDTPRYVDYILFGAFCWARGVSPQKLLERDDPLFAWRKRLLEAHGGIAGQTKGYPV
jgi:glutathione S-transferase